MMKTSGIQDFMITIWPWVMQPRHLVIRGELILVIMHILDIKN
jgi:hypothetical protein